MTQVIEATLEQVEAYIRAGHKISVETPSGFHPLKALYNNGVRQTYLVNGLIGLTGDHALYDEAGEKVLVANLKPGSKVRNYEGGLTEIISIEPAGLREVADLHIDHQDHNFYAEGLWVANCDDKQSVLHISSKKRRPEEGSTHLEPLKRTIKDPETNQKLLIEIWQEGGVYSAIDPKWFRHAINRAVMLAAWELGWDLTESLLYERWENSRNLYRLKAENFKSLVSGSTVFELNFNAGFNWTPEKTEALLARINHHVTAGWNVISIKQVGADFILKNSLKYSLVTYRFDSRKVNTDTVNLKLLQAKVEAFGSGSSMKYRKQVRVNKNSVKSMAVDFDTSKILYMTAGIGRNSHEIVFSVLAAVEEVHPLIFLAGFLSDGPNPKSYNGLYGTDIVIEGFYTAPSQGGSVFAINDDHEHATDCPSCGAQKNINLLTGLPFGSMPHERNDLLLHKYGSPVCVHCFMEERS